MRKLYAQHCGQVAAAHPAALTAGGQARPSLAASYRCHTLSLCSHLAWTSSPQASSAHIVVHTDTAAVLAAVQIPKTWVCQYERS